MKRNGFRVFNTAGKVIAVVSVIDLIDFREDCEHILIIIRG